MLFGPWRTGLVFFLNQIQGWTAVREYYSPALEQVTLFLGQRKEKIWDTKEGRKEMLVLLAIAFAFVVDCVSGYPFGMECEDNPDLCKEGCVKECPKSLAIGCVNRGVGFTQPRIILLGHLCRYFDRVQCILG